MKGIARIEDFIARAKAKGYRTEGSIFKVDYNGTTYNVGFWIRPHNWNQAKDQYDLPGICDKVRHADFNQAVDLLCSENEYLIS